ncbi:hypothetical protein GGP41_007023 [Bipolaris sorokiniana]|uniref:Uncharacterized protein n=1 Tax=Cochliobolus sativus TaxID=45130 RepID=A0A8H5ZP43_COCSA|nr:hypothetical protein GGP41_007023 [Bipolaris sorokiniana]
MPTEKRRKAEVSATVPELGNPGQRCRDKIASLEAQIDAQNGGRSFIQLRLALPVETAVNSGPFTICPKDTSNVEEHNIFSLDGAMLAFDAVNIDFSLSSDCSRLAYLTPMTSISFITDHLQDIRNLPTPDNPNKWHYQYPVLLRRPTPPQTPNPNPHPSPSR